MRRRLPPHPECRRILRLPQDETVENPHDPARRHERIFHRLRRLRGAHLRVVAADYGLAELVYLRAHLRRKIRTEIGRKDRRGRLGGVHDRLCRRDERRIAGACPRHPKTGDERRVRELRPRDLGEQLHVMLTQRDAQPVLPLRAVQSGGRRLHLHGPLRFDLLDDVIKSFATRRPVRRRERGRLTVEKSLCVAQRVELGLLGLVHNSLLVMNGRADGWARRARAPFRRRAGTVFWGQDVLSAREGRVSARAASLSAREGPI